MVRSCIALAALVAAGCSTVRIVKQPLSDIDAQSITRELEGKAASIKLRDQARSTDGTDVVVTPAAVEWDQSMSSGQPRMQVPPEAIDRISFRKRARGALDGMLLGLGIGVGVAMVNGVERGGERGALAIIGAVEVGLASALVLAFIGGAIGHPYSIELAPSPPR